MQAKTKHILIDSISSLLVLLFVYTAISKLIDYQSFKLVIGNSPLIASFNNFLAWFLPVIELLVAILLLVPASRAWGMLASLLLMTLFTMYIIYMVSFSSHLPCSCGGVLKELSWPGHLLFNIFFTLLALTGYLLMKHKELFITINRVSRKPVEQSRRSLNT